MNRLVVALTLTVALVGGQYIYQTSGPCGDWYDRYYDLPMRQSPVIPTLEEIEDQIGELPFACPQLGDWR